MKWLETVHDGFTVRYDGQSIVTVRQQGVSPEAFDLQLRRAHEVLRRFDMSKPGSVWGCDGIGYAAQQRRGEVLVHKSGVGPRKAEAGFKGLAS